MNEPYVKQFDENGDLLNPIKDKYESKTFLKMEVNELTKEETPLYSPNRKERRMSNRTKNLN